MALQPIDETHALQIQAGALGRKTGHAFEDAITERINTLRYPMACIPPGSSHVFTGDPALLLLNYIATCNGLSTVSSASAISTGALATSEEGKRWLSINGAALSRCKSDLVVTINAEGFEPTTVGISTKQCNNQTPTNAQLYFTTARGFVNLLRSNGICVSDTALYALRQFCGDPGHRPSDSDAVVFERKIDPRRFFWEEIEPDGREEWSRTFTDKQDEISRLLFQKAYINDPFTPDFLLHKTRKSQSWAETEVAIYSIDELIALSGRYQPFATKPYCVRKGSFKDPIGVSHMAPRFGIIQMQRGGQKQHPEQLQFNLEARYFYSI